MLVYPRAMKLILSITYFVHLQSRSINGVPYELNILDETRRKFDRSKGELIVVHVARLYRC